MRGRAVRAALLLVVLGSGCKSMPFTHDATAPSRDAYVGAEKIWDVEWWNALVAPPSFAFTCNSPKGVPDRFQRYLLNHLRATFRLQLPVRLFFRERPGRQKRADRVGTYKARKKAARRR